MKASSALFGFTGSILVFIYAVTLVFFRHEILPSAGGASKFNPDSFILLISGLLGLFGGLIGAAGSALSFWDRELSGIMLLGAAVSGAVMFAALSVLFHLVYITGPNRYVTLATGIVAFIILTVSGVFSLTPRRDSAER
jgi:hypothetical protein